MRIAAIAAAAAFLLALCSQSSKPVASVSPTVGPTSGVATTASPTASPRPSPPPCTPGSAAYGLLIAGDNLQLITTCGTVQASAPMAPGSVKLCSPGGLAANLKPPVSASNNRVYYRDGDTKIRYLTPAGQSADVTTVPGGPTTVSFFSVSPDDQRIAVIVEDVSASEISLRLYVEDLNGGGHHSDIYSTTSPKSGGDTLWPMGWHQGAIVIARMSACPVIPGRSPTSWALVNAATAIRLLSINGICGPDRPGLLSAWPSPAGVACVDFRFHTTLFDWAGGSTDHSVGAVGNDARSGVSPSGGRFFVATSAQARCGNGPGTCLYGSDLPFMNHTAVDALIACQWIDEDHLLSPSAVFAIPTDPRPAGDQTKVYVDVIPLAEGTCAGRFPGGL